MRLRFRYADVTATLALVVALAGVSVAAVSSIPGRDRLIHGCYRTKTGSLRVVAAAKRCAKGEQAIAWSQVGPAGAPGAAGAPGPKGDRGDVGPATGAAGGDLTGRYPAPAIAPGVVTPVKLGAIPSARVTSSSDQTIAGSLAQTPLTFDTVVFDRTGQMWSAANPTRLTAPINGVYLVTAEVYWENSQLGDRALVLVDNGSNVSGTAVAHATGVGVGESTTTQVFMNAGDYVEAQVVQTSGSSLKSVHGIDSDPALELTWIAP